MRNNNRRFAIKSLLAGLLILGLMVMLSSCLPQAGRSGQKIIQDFSTGDIDPPTDEGCTKLVDTTFELCLDECEVGTHIAEPGTVEFDDAVNAFDTSDLDEAQLADFEILLTQIAGICVADIIRPSDQIFVNRDFCSCIDSSADIINNCSSFCAGKGTGGEATLFGSVTLGPDVQFNEKLGDLHSWCTAEIGDGLTQPSCVLEAFDQNGGIQNLGITTSAGSNSFTAKLDSLSKNLTYVMTIKEITSGAQSDSFQLRRIDPIDPNAPPNTPLKIMPASQYTCITKSTAQDLDGTAFINAVRLHFYFAANKQPAILPPDTLNIICHDPFPPQTPDDDPLYPRLELIPQHFSVWDESDVRMFDTDANNLADINDIIKQKLLDEHGIVRDTVAIFGELRWPNRPGSSGVQPRVGFIMNPFINPQTGRGFCPTSADYNGNDPTFKVMKEIVGVDTEALWISRKQPENILDDSGNPTPAPNDFLFIREGILKKIWFYFENGQHFVPDDITAGQKTIMFYWPPDVDDPYVQKSTQKIYTVISSSDTSSTPTAGLNTVVTSPDKRFACVPKLGDEALDQY